MNLRFVFCLLLISSFAVVQGKSQNKNFDRSTFYTILKSGGAEEIDAQVNIVKGSSITEKEAYEGALLMKRSGMFSKAKDKLNMFKSGRSKLESAKQKIKRIPNTAFCGSSSRSMLPGSSNTGMNWKKTASGYSQILKVFHHFFNR